MVLLLIVILVLIMLTATLFESVFGMAHYAAGYTALALWGAGIIAIVWFYLFTSKGRAIVRTWNIKDLRKKRIEREFHESWRRANKHFIAMDNKRIARGIDRMTKGLGCGTSADESSTVGCYGSDSGDGSDCGDGSAF